ncbi:ABC transporter substrate-binding protein [Aquamicrobium sp. LC103]|uniref:ABC transporter substrate-binding protein n=1 Tax=Aquamicrobium sp. LC103 TaxID=1120658 RepID=UPI00063E96ED|nr:ABC transporter substrate-binding protein [Aquamicrobium sp. LC103]TKT74483.1 ABC transporter substrate-binding protein [Aquamicrobium sp. LC103]
MTVLKAGLRGRAQAVMLGVALALAVPAASAQEVTIRWGNTAPAAVPHALSAILALDPELQKKHGIKVEMINFQGNSSNCMAALIGNAVDFCQTGISTGLYAIAEGAAIKSFSMMGGQVGELALNKATAERVAVTADEPIKERLSKLKGLQITGSGPGTPNYMLLDVMLKKAGLSINDLQFRTLVDITAMNEGVRNGAIDGVWWSLGALGPALGDGSAVQVISLARGDFPEFKGVALTAIYANTSWLEANRDTAKRAKAAMVEALQKWRADPRGYGEEYKKTYLEAMPDETWNNIVDQNLVAFFDDMTGTAPGWDFWIDIMKTEGKEGSEKAAFAHAFDTLE